MLLSGHAAKGLQRPNFVYPNAASRQARGLLLWYVPSFNAPGLVYRRMNADGFYSAAYVGGATVYGHTFGAMANIAGSTQYVSFGASTTLTSFTKFSLAAWCRWRNFTGSFPIIAARGLLSGASRDYIWYLNGSTQAMSLEVYTGSNVKDTVTSASSVVTAGPWYLCHAVAQTSTTMALYVNGVQIAVMTPTVYTTATPNLGSFLSLGNVNDTGYPMAGQISEFRLYDIALTPEDVKHQVANPNDLILVPGRRVFFDLAAARAHRFGTNQSVPRSSYF